jgi:hypothetical protein
MSKKQISILQYAYRNGASGPEIGDVMTLNAIADEIKAHSDSCRPLSKQIFQMSEGFDLDGIQKLAESLDFC